MILMVLDNSQNMCHKQEASNIMVNKKPGIHLHDVIIRNQMKRKTQVSDRLSYVVAYHFQN